MGKGTLEEIKESPLFPRDNINKTNLIKDLTKRTKEAVIKMKNNLTKDYEYLGPGK